MSDYIAKNEPLEFNEMLINANIINDFLSARGWTLNAICGLLANAQAESLINAGAWQGYKEIEKLGYGLLQWTPSTKVTEWLLLKGYQKDSLVGQLRRILFELENKLQYYKTSKYPLTFEEYTKSEESPEYLAYCFMNNYERPANRNQPLRQEFARNWYDRFTCSDVALQGIITGDSVNIRKESNINSTVLGQVNKGCEVEVLKTFGSWVQIKVPIVAYVHEDYIK